MIIRSINNLDVISPVTYLAGPIASGVGTAPSQNLAGFSTSWAVQIGRTGAEKTEVMLLSASTPAGTIGTFTANTVYDHPTDTPVYGIKYDQVVFERSTVGTLGTAAPISAGTVSYQADGTVTIFDDTTGSVSYGYRTYFRNSVLNTTTTESAWITSSGFANFALGKIRQRVKDKLYNASFIPDDTIINDWINEWLELMNNTMVTVNEGYGVGTTQVAYAINVELGTITDTNFRGQTTRVWYADSSGTFTARKMDSNSFYPTTVYSNLNPYYYMQGDTIIGRKPVDAAGTLLIEYPINPVILSNDTDLLPTPMQGYTQSFVDYALGQAKGKDNKPEEQMKLESKAEAQRAKFAMQIAPRLKSGPTFIDIVEQLATEDNIFF